MLNGQRGGRKRITSKSKMLITSGRGRVGLERLQAIQDCVVIRLLGDFRHHL